MCEQYSLNAHKKIEKTEKKVKIDIDRYRAKEGEKINLKKFSTNCDMDVDKEYVKTVSMTAALEELSLYQAKLYAQNTYGLIIVLQAMDAAGKDGTVNHVFANLDPGGVSVASFKQPTTEEKDHDYMWRINKALPPRGNIGIFNRSHYEDVVVTRVHDLIENDKIPKDLVDKNIWETRYRQIRDWERYLAENGFHIIKIFLHVSKDEQRDRLAERILNKKKNWKFSIADINERRFWDRYQDLYSEMIEETSTENKADDLFSHAETNTADGQYTRKDAISENGLKHFENAYPTETISKEDIFYYVYGLLHSEDYRTRYADNLTKELPRIPCVKKSDDFWAFSKAGRDLAHWHLNYETVEPYKAKLDLGGKSLKQLEDKDFYVTKMKFPKKDQKDTLIYNNAITIREIPLEAYDYVVNGKSALEWVMERQGVSTHKDSGIVNDANDWAIETMGDAKYPLELFLRVITVSLETMKIVKSLPRLDI